MARQAVKVGKKTLEQATAGDDPKESGSERDPLAGFGWNTNKGMGREWFGRPNSVKALPISMEIPLVSGNVG